MPFKYLKKSTFMNDQEKQIEALKAEVERLKKQHGEYVAGKVTLKELAIRNGTLTASVGTEMAQIMASQFMELLNKHAAENYLEMQFTERKTMKFITVTIQRHEKKTPHQIRLELEKDNSALRKQIEQLTAENEAMQNGFDEIFRLWLSGEGLNDKRNEFAGKMQAAAAKALSSIRSHEKREQQDKTINSVCVQLEQSKKQIEQLTAELEKAKQDQKRLNWLIETSALHPDGEHIVLCVTEKAVKSCKGTWLPEYADQVRKVIDAGIESSTP